MSEAMPIRSMRPEAFFARLVETMPDGSVVVRKIGDGELVTIAAHQARRIADLKPGTLIEYAWEYATASRTNIATRARPLEDGARLLRRVDGATAAE
jgi:hypothetical protein